MEGALDDDEGSGSSPNQEEELSTGAHCEVVAALGLPGLQGYYRMLVVWLGSSSLPCSYNLAMLSVVSPYIPAVQGS